MLDAIERTALFKYLDLRDTEYSGTLQRLRKEITKWLAYTPATFPHYTSHTVAHSDQIVIELSHLLFDKYEDPATCRLDLSTTEAYILMAAAYLHDAGMVASDNEKISLLKSTEWQDWVQGEGGGAKRWNEIEQMRSAPSADPSTGNYVADLQTRFLIAEFIRARHHLRAADVITQYADRLGAFTFSDPALEQTIADVCIAHGLPNHELEDAARYPDRRDLRGDTVNVRLMAILLRLGDLLDMSCDRACPLLLNAACPLPPDSLAHWTQYQRIQHKLVAPDAIQVHARCENQEEHTFLEDWCQWLVQEVRNAAVLVTRSHRHNDWKLPVVAMDGQSIRIEPSPKAKYIPSRWNFELDRDLIIERFVFNVHERSEEFIRELLQNAFDANRCRMYLDLAGAHLPQPESPTKVEQSWRDRYPVYVTLENTRRRNDLSGEMEEKQVLTIDDRGVGMDRDVISRFFLQIGRSYYRSDQFRKKFTFVPTSRFGVGFLSVFSASDDVVVETFNPESANREPLLLRLRGPKSFLLTERGDRRIAGTRIEIVLRSPFAPGDLTKWVSDWCRRVEFPVIVDELGQRKEIRAETAAEFVKEVKDLSRPASVFVIRANKIDEPDMEGELYTVARRVKTTEYWNIDNSYFENYVSERAGAVIPEIPENLFCLNGIRLVSNYAYNVNLIPRIDFRGRQITNLSRSTFRGGATVLREPAIQHHVALLLRDHLKEHTGCSWEDWLYKLELAERFDFLGAFWDDVPSGIVLKRGTETKGHTLAEAAGEAIVRLYAVNPDLQVDPEQVDARPPEWAVPFPPYNADLTVYFAQRLLASRRPVSITIEPHGNVLSEWIVREGDNLDGVPVCEFQGQQPLSVTLFPMTGEDKNQNALNVNHPLMIWLRSPETGKLLGETQLREVRSRIVGYATGAEGTLQEYLNSLKSLHKLPPRLAPPKVKTPPKKKV